MARYSIEDTTLTALGDAVRGKVGETKMETILVEEVIPAVETVKSPKPYPTQTSGAYQTFTMSEASKIEVSLKCYPPASQNLYIAEGIANNDDEFDLLTIVKTYTGNYSGTNQTGKFIMNGNSITFKMQNITSVDSGYFFTADCVALDANGNPIGGTTVLVEKEVEVKNTMTPAEMAEAIEELPPSPPESAYTITGDCDYRFQNNGWNWFVEQYGDKVITEDITTCASMFNGSDTLTKIPFDINISPATNSITYLTNMFLDCNKLTNIPKINFTTPLDTASGTSKGAVKLTSAFEHCENIKEIDYDIFNNMFTEKYAEEALACSGTNNARNSLFDCCSRLRKHPDLSRVMTGATGSNNMYNFLFYKCYCLDEIVNLPVHPSNTTTSNMFSSTFGDCQRLKRMTFATQADGTPYTRTWKNQTIDISGSIGYGIYLPTYYQSHGSETEIDDDASYQVNKNNEDSWTSRIAYSRYNHDSAVETINTLPDVSSGSGNTIKFTGAAGSATDGGAINTMTQEEIAVATAKGWTVSFA